MAQFDLNRSNDTAIATQLLNEITPEVWPTLPLPVDDMDPANDRAGLPSYADMSGWAGGADGDDVNVASATQSIIDASGRSASFPYVPVNQGHKAEIMVPPTPLAVDVTTPRGWIGPLDPYGPAPTPTITAIDPTSSPVGPGDSFVLTVTGTNFLPGSIILFGNNPLGERTTFVSETELTTIIRRDLFPNPDPAVKVRVSTGGVVSNEVDFAFTVA